MVSMEDKSVEIVDGQHPSEVMDHVTLVLAELGIRVIYEGNNVYKFERMEAI